MYTGHKIQYLDPIDNTYRFGKVTSTNITPNNKLIHNFTLTATCIPVPNNTTSLENIEKSLFTVTWDDHTKRWIRR